MMAGLSAAVMALAARMLGEHRRDWALAMEAEFEAAREDGRPLAFALGCLLAACRELPGHAEGRFALASHVLALAVIVPVAALMVSSVLLGFPGSYSGSGQALVNDANRAAVPSLAGLVMLLAALNLGMAWLALDRDWTRVSEAGALSAAATVTLVIFSTVVFADPVPAIAQAALLAVELAGISALARWHGRLAHRRFQTG